MPFARGGASRLTFLLGQILSFICCLSLVALAFPRRRHAMAVNAWVRVNQVGYDAAGPKRAFLMASDNEAAASFLVSTTGGSQTLQGQLGTDRGPWGSFAHVYPIDFDQLASPGTYTVTLPDLGISSPSFQIAPAASLFSGALSNSLFFYQNQRDGADFLQTPLRTAPAHLNDVHGVVYKVPRMNPDGAFPGHLKPTGAVIDASGGWWDAGDYLKFVETHSYAVSLLLIGVRDFPDLMGPGSLSDFSGEAEFGLDWLRKMWDDANQTLYYQVGIGEANSRFAADHDIWRLPQVDDTMGGSDPAFRYIRNRPVFAASKPGKPISPNLAGRMAASLALGFQIFKDSQPDLANQWLLAAEHIFDLADTNPGRLVTAAPFDSYPEVEWRDDLELGAVELNLALSGSAAGLPAGLPHNDPMFYLMAAADWASAYISGPNDAADTLNLYDVSGLAHFELCRAIDKAGNPKGLALGRAELLADLKKQLDGAAALASQDPFGFGTAWSESDSATRGAALSIVANEYDFLTGTPAYSNLAVQQVDAILGANAWGSSFIAGDGSVFPFCMQHQVANLAGSTDGTAPVLKGALVEGPNSSGSSGFLDGMVPCPAGGSDQFARFNGNGAVYIDNVQSFATVEPAIDLTAPSPLAFAWMMEKTPAPLPRE